VIDDKPLVQHRPDKRGLERDGQPWISLATMGLKASALLTDSGSTPERTTKKPITMPTRRRNISEFAVCRTMAIRFESFRRTISDLIEQLLPSWYSNSRSYFPLRDSGTGMPVFRSFNSSFVR